MEKYQWDQQDVTKVARRDKDEQMQDTKRDDFKAPKHKSAKLAVYTNTTDIHQQAVLTPAVCVRSDRRGSGALLLAVWFHACSTCV